MFAKLCYRSRTTDNETYFKIALLTLSTEFPNCRRWLKWWIHLANASMAFIFFTKQNSWLLNHPCKTSNAAEAYHSNLYLIIQQNQSLSTSLRYLLQYAKIGGDSINTFFKKSILSSYSHQKKVKQNRVIKDYYKIGDSRAPDNNKVLFSGKEPVYNDAFNVSTPVKRSFEEMFDANFIDITVENDNYINIQNFIDSLKETDVIAQTKAEQKVKTLLRKYVQERVVNQIDDENKHEHGRLEEPMNKEELMLMLEKLLEKEDVVVSLREDISIMEENERINDDKVSDETKDDSSFGFGSDDIDASYDAYIDLNV